MASAMSAGFYAVELGLGDALDCVGLGVQEMVKGPLNSPAAK